MDKHLRKMEYSRALANALKNSEKYPIKAAALLQELLKRNVLHPAMLGLDDQQIRKLFIFTRKHLGEAKFNRTIIDVLNVIVDVFGNQIHQLTKDNQFLYENLAKK